MGSTRVIIDSANGNVLSMNDYYPFGMRIKKPTFAYNDNRYLYNGKEDQSVAGTDFLDYGWRNYDALLGRWFNVDPLAEKYYGMSPYVYVGNNPIIYIDPDGKKHKLVFDKKNSTVIVKANYYHDINSGDYARKGVSYWNNQKGHTLTIKGTTYKVKYDLKAKRTSDPLNKGRKDPIGNSIRILRPENKKAAGTATYQGDIRLDEGYRYNDDVIAHEIGHTLGMALPFLDEEGNIIDNHSLEGLMVPVLYQEGWSNDILQENIDQMYEKDKENRQLFFREMLRIFLFWDQETERQVNLKVKNK